MIDYDKLIHGLDYTAYEHAKDFEDGLEEQGVENPAIIVDRSYENGTPVVEVEAEDLVGEKSYSDEYRLEEVNREEFEDVMFDIWRSVMEDLE